MTRDLKETQRRWDTFAAAALTGLLANGNMHAYAVKSAQEVADAMMFDFKPNEESGVMRQYYDE